MRLLLWLFCIPPALLMVSCSSVTTKDDLIDSRTETLLLLYETSLAAQTSAPESACLGFLKVAQDKKFNLSQAALLRAYLLCPRGQALPALPTALSAENSWLKSLAFQVELKLAADQNNNLKQANVYYRLGIKSNLSREKVKFYLQAQTLLQGDESLEALQLKAELQSRLEKIAPRFIQNPNPEDFQRVAADLISQRQFNDGRVLLQKIFDNKKSTLEEKYFALKGIRNSFKTEQRREDYLHAAEFLAQWSIKKLQPGRVHEAFVILARAHWTHGNRTETEKFLLRAEKLVKGKYPLDEIYFIRGKMAEEIQQFEEAIQIYTKAQESIEKSPQIKSNFFDRILFSKAWCLRKLNRFNEAKIALAEIKDRSSDVFEKNKYAYWYGRTQLDLGETEPAMTTWKVLAEQDPIGFYGLLSYRELKQPIPALEAELLSKSSLKKPSSVNQDEHLLIRNLVFVGEKQLLEEYLKTFVTDLRAKRDLDPETWLYYLKAYAKADLYLPLFAELGGLNAEMRNSLLKKYPELLFPRKYLDSVVKWADKTGVSPELILSIMRQESAFDPNARSPADAMGLMQVLPSVAKDHEKIVGSELHHFEDLYAPDLNISFGAAILADLKTKYKGQFVLMAAAYNANDIAIKGWLKTRLHEDPIAFIEDIPYEETRAYIKLVLRNFIFYSRLNHPNQSFEFPTWAFEGLKEFRDIVKID